MRAKPELYSITQSPEFVNPQGPALAQSKGSRVVKSRRKPVRHASRGMASSISGVIFKEVPVYVEHRSRGFSKSSEIVSDQDLSSFDGNDHYLPMIPSLADTPRAEESL
jgi:hypothetical protein